MNLLGIEAAASPPSVALSLNGVVSERLCDEPRAQAEHILALVQQLLAEHSLTLGELDGIAVGRGPGSFTGLRVAAATAQGLAYSSGMQVASVSTLASLAHQAFAVDDPLGGDEGPLLVCLDARKAQVYCALYESGELGHPRQVSQESVMDPADVVAQFKGKARRAVGNAFMLYPELEQLGPIAAEMVPSARAVVTRASSGAVEFDRPYLAVPEYVRNNVTHGS